MVFDPRKMQIINTDNPLLDLYRMGALLVDVYTDPSVLPRIEYILVIEDEHHCWIPTGELPSGRWQVMLGKVTLIDSAEPTCDTAGCINPEHVVDREEYKRIAMWMRIHRQSRTETMWGR